MCRRATRLSRHSQCCRTLGRRLINVEIAQESIWSRHATRILTPLVIDKDICWLDVAVHNVVLCEVCHCFAKLPGHASQVGGRNPGRGWGFVLAGQVALQIAMHLAYGQMEMEKIRLHKSRF